MADKPRYFDPRSYYHIYNRSLQERQKIFLSKRDYQRFLSLLVYYQFKHPLSYAQFEQFSLHHHFLDLGGLEKQGEKRVKLLAYVIMPNHFHLLIKPLEEPSLVSKFVSDVTNSYTRYFNLKNGRSGSLFQGKFKSKEISDEGSLLQVSRYIHLNPLISSKANPGGIFKKPQEWIYSSYQEWAGLKNPHLVDKDEVTSWGSKVEGPSGYRKFVESKINKNSALGIESLIIEKEAPKS